ncbi:MAG: RNA-binding cell elongation regulator Jag/EloR [Dehalococcoidia bacterium]|nr:RNA-binding cell elongation regulator Jag/EloR [Dehalococcoidia bacterium]
MERLEISGKTVEEATERALQQLGVSRDQIEIEVVSKGKSGILGLGAEEARIAVTLKGAPSVQAPQVAQLAKQTLDTLLGYMGMSASVEIRQPPQTGEGAPAVSLDITGDDLGILIGRRGETLASLQYVLNLMVSRSIKAHAGINVDVEGYKERRAEALKTLALRMAERVRETGRSITLEPMPPNERRLVHLALKDSPDVNTYSVGEGESRKVAIAPGKKAQQE